MAFKKAQNTVKRHKMALKRYKMALKRHNMTLKRYKMALKRMNNAHCSSWLGDKSEPWPRQGGDSVIITNC